MARLAYATWIYREYRQHSGNHIYKHRSHALRCSGLDMSREKNFVLAARFEIFDAKIYTYNSVISNVQADLRNRTRDNQSRIKIV